MKGFSDTTLILFSDPRKYVEATGLWRRQYALAVSNLLQYLSDKDTWVRCLITDPLSVSLIDKETRGVEWYATENPGGMYFITHNSSAPDDLPMVKLQSDIVELLDKKFPIERGCTVEERGYRTSKRVSLAEKTLIQRSKCIFCFGKLFNPHPKENDGRAVIFINNQFIPTLKLSGHDAPISSFLDVPWGNLALTEWGRYLNGG